MVYANRLKMLIALEGFVGLAVIILSMRQLSIFVGSSVVVSSFIMGLVLAAFAYGHQQGTTYINNLSDVIAQNLIVAAFFMGIGLSYCFTVLFFNIIERKIGANNFVAFITYLITIIMPYFYYLGKTLPATINLYNQYRPEARKIELFYLGIEGAVLGAILTSILFMHFWGLKATILLNTAMLLIASLLVSDKRKISIKNVLLMISLIPFIYFFNYQEARMGILASNEYSNYAVTRNYPLENHRFGTIFSINNSASSFAENYNAKGFSYIEKIKNILFQQLGIKNKKILVLGAGGFSLSASDTFDNKFIYVDIDPNLKKVVEKNNIANINGEFIASDARVFLRKNTSLYDVVVSDVYSHKTTIPTHLITKEYFELISNNLSKNGIAVFNIIINPFLKDSFSSKIDRTIRSVFGFCSTTTMDYSSKISNVIYLCIPGKANTMSNIYTDDNNQATLDSVLTKF